MHMESKIRFGLCLKKSYRLYDYISIFAYSFNNILNIINERERYPGRVIREQLCKVRCHTNMISYINMT